MHARTRVDWFARVLCVRRWTTASVLRPQSNVVVRFSFAFSPARAYAIERARVQVTCTMSNSRSVRNSRLLNDLTLTDLPCEHSPPAYCL